MIINVMFYDLVSGAYDEPDYSNLCYEDLWDAYLEAEEEENEHEAETIWNEIERRRDLYR